MFSSETAYSQSSVLLALGGHVSLAPLSERPVGAEGAREARAALWVFFKESCDQGVRERGSEEWCSAESWPPTEGQA